MQKQKLKLKNTLKLAPVQMYFLKMISLNADQFEDYIKKELEENEAITQDDIDTLEIDNNSDFIIKNKENYYNNNRDNQKEIVFESQESILDMLETQLDSLHLNEKEYQIGRFILGAIDDIGYIRQHNFEIADDLLIKQNIDASEEMIESVIQKIQTLEPCGIGARNLKECLIIQLKNKKQTPVIVRSISVLENYFELFTNRKFDKIMSLSDISKSELKQILSQISKLNPKPLSSWERDNFKNEFIFPDFTVNRDSDNRLTIELNEKYIPSLRISNEYQNLAERYRENPNRETREAFSYINQKIQSAKWFLDAVNKRRQTLKKVGEYLIVCQKKFFLTGDKVNLVPITQKEFAKKINMDTSTVSRVVNSKYIETPFGIFSLKSFFSQKVSDDLEESSIKIKSFVKNIIDSENKLRPFSDENISRILEKKGYKIARRTITKYRENMQIPIARFRKKI